MAIVYLLRSCQRLFGPDHPLHYSLHLKLQVQT